MGKGKGTFEFWATRYDSLSWACASNDVYPYSVSTGRVIFEIGGTPIREELAREGLHPPERSFDL